MLGKLCIVVFTAQSQVVMEFKDVATRSYDSKARWSAEEVDIPNSKIESHNVRIAKATSLRTILLVLVQDFDSTMEQMKSKSSWSGARSSLASCSKYRVFQSSLTDFV